VEIIDSHHVIVAYHNDNNHGIIKTYYIDDNGNIEFYMSVDHSDYAINHKLLKHTNSQYIALYSDATSQQIETFTLNIAEDFNLEAKEEQLTGGFTPELEISELKFAGETIFPIIAAYSLPLISQVKIKNKLVSKVTHLP